MEKLTKKQEEILNIVKKNIAKNGYAPTVREICKEANLNSSATVFVHLKHLAKKGYISQKSSKFRTLEVLVPNEYIEEKEEVMQVPLLGKVTAGNPIEAIQFPDEYISLPRYLVPKNQEIFALNVSGESMINAGIFDKDIVIIKRTNVARNGEIVVALNENNEVTLKTFYKEKDHFRLQPENDYMEPIILDSVTILGKVIGLYRKF